MLQAGAENEPYISIPVLSNHPFFWHADCVFQLQIDSIYKTSWGSLSQMPTCLWRIWIGELDGWMLKGISVLYEAGLIFPLILTTSNTKVLEPKMLYTVMAVPRRGKQTTQSRWQYRSLFFQMKIKLWIKMPGDLFCLLGDFLLSEFDDCPLKRSFIVFSAVRPAVLSVGIATPHPSNQSQWQMWYCLWPYKHQTPNISLINWQRDLLNRDERPYLNVYWNAPPTPPVLSKWHTNTRTKTHTPTEKAGCSVQQEKKNPIKFVLFRSLPSLLPLSQGLQFHSYF